MRVKRILSSASSTDIPMVKRYYYGEMTNKEVSSLFDAPTPKYYKDTKSTVSCQIQVLESSLALTILLAMWGNVSNSLNSLFTYGQRL